MTLEQSRRGVEQEREQQAFRLGEIEGALEGAPGGGPVAERVAGDRLEQERLNYPEMGVRQRDGAVDDGRERLRRRLRIVLGEPQHRDSVAHFPAVALLLVQPGQGLFDAPRFTDPHERLQQVRSQPA